jgi:hypothetical protein
MRLVAYRPDSGDIYMTITTGLVEIPSKPDYLLEHDTAEPGTHFVDVLQIQHVVVSKSFVVFNADKTEIDADGIDEITLSDLPDCVADFNGAQIVVDDGELILTADVAGSYSVTLRGVPYLDTVFNFEAV